MQTQGRLPGFKYIYGTGDENTAVLRLPGEGLLGLVGKKNEWVIRRNDPDGVSRVSGEMSVHSPIRLLQDGTISEASDELLRWLHPILAKAGFL